MSTRPSSAIDRASVALLLGLVLGLVLGLSAGCEEPAPAVDAGPADGGLDAGTDAGRDAGPPPVDAGPPLPPPPALLSEAGLFVSGVSGDYAPGILSFEVRQPLWTDGLEKRRHLWLPEGGIIDTSDPDHWVFPEGTRLFKEFLLEGRPLETRMLWKSGPSSADWVYISYRYREDGSEADAVPDGEADVLGTWHNVPSTADCRNCHQGSRDFVIGVSAYQLSRERFDEWTTAGILPAGSAFAEPPGSEIESAALGYLHGNCGHCHNDVHPLSGARTLRFRLPVGLSSASEAPALLTSLGMLAHHDIGGTFTILVAGDPEGSQLYVRMQDRAGYEMPPVGTEMQDPAGLEAVRAWILDL